MNLEEVSNLVNEIGGEDFGFLKVIGLKNKATVVEVFSKKTKEKKQVYLNSLKKGCKPIFKKDYLLNLEEEVKKLGKGKFILKSVVQVKNNYHKVVEVRCLESKKVEKVQLDHLRAGFNPFEKNICKEIHVLHPIVEKMLKKHGLFYKKEFFLTKSSRVDFYVENKFNDVFFVEVKDDLLYQSKKKIKNQVEKYKKAGKRKIKNYKKTILTSPSGKVGINFKELNKVLCHLSQNKA